MSKLLFGFIFIVTTIFSKDELEFQIEKIKNKNIEILLTKNIKNIRKYKIQRGDTLSELSLKLNNNMDILIELNDIKNKDLIIINEKLKYIEKEEKRNEI
ncbi:MAG: LysM peptidoglycan-binding domain-containing protein [Cetobacterium sp.]